MKDLQYRRLVVALVNKDKGMAMKIIRNMEDSVFYRNAYDLGMIKRLVKGGLFYNAYMFVRKNFEEV